jgi:hypothetical protein
MCVTAILKETERKRQDRSVHCAEERRRWARVMGGRGPTCPHSGVLAHLDAAKGTKHLIGRQNRANFPDNGTPLGEWRL